MRDIKPKKKNRKEIQRSELAHELARGEVSWASLVLSLLLVCDVGHLAKLKLLGEVARQDAKLLDDGLANLNHGLTRSNLTIGLDTQLEVGGQRVGNLERVSNCDSGEALFSMQKAYLVGRENDTGVSEKTAAQQVGQGVVLLVESEDRGGWET